MAFRTIRVFWGFFQAYDKDMQQYQRTAEMDFYGCYCHPVVMCRTADIDSSSYVLSAQLIYALPQSYTSLLSVVRVQIRDEAYESIRLFPATHKGLIMSHLRLMEESIALTNAFM